LTSPSNGPCRNTSPLVALHAPFFFLLSNFISHSPSDDCDQRYRRHYGLVCGLIVDGARVPEIQANEENTRPSQNRLVTVAIISSICIGMFSYIGYGTSLRLDSKRRGFEACQRVSLLPASDDHTPRPDCRQDAASRVPSNL